MAFANIETPAAGKSKVLRLKSSFDNGATWTDNIGPPGITDTFGVVQSRTVAVDDNDDMSCLQVPGTGTVLCVFRNHSVTGEGGPATRYRITLHRSTDYGKTFAWTATIFEWDAARDPNANPPQAANARNGLYQPFLNNWTLSPYRSTGPRRLAQPT